MSADRSSKKPSKIIKWVGITLSVLPSLMLLFSGVMSIAKPKEVVENTLKVGYAESTLVPLGIVLLTSTILYLIPRTCVIGAILLTGYLGGAVATHVRLGDPLYSHILLPVYFGIVLWIGLVLRFPKLRSAVFGPTGS